MFKTLNALIWTQEHDQPPGELGNWSYNRDDVAPPSEYSRDVVADEFKEVSAV